MPGTPVKQYYFSRKTIISVCVAWYFIASANVLAEEPTYIYADDIIKRTKSNNKQENWRYRQPPPSKIQANPLSPVNQPTYLPPIQQPGSNPFTSPGQTYRFVDDNETDRSDTAIEQNYNYPPPTQKPGSNPFFR